jgi:hypothetical protein
MGRAMAQIDRRLSRLGKRVLIRAIADLKVSICEQQRFAGSGKADVRPAFLGQLQVDA